MERSIVSFRSISRNWRLFLLCFLGAMLFFSGSFQQSARCLPVLLNASLVPEKGFLEQLHRVTPERGMTSLPESSRFSFDTATVKTTLSHARDSFPLALAQTEYAGIVSEKLFSRRITPPRQITSENKRLFYPHVFLQHSFVVLPERVFLSTGSGRPLSCSWLPAYRGPVFFSIPPPSC